MNQDDEGLPPEELRWYCLRTRMKQEEMAARVLTPLPGVKVFLPRMKFRRATRRGPVWFTEALFPCYLFAQFDRPRMLRRIIHSQGVTGIVHFGDHIPAIPETIVDRLRQELGQTEIKVFDQPLNPGDHATVVEGPLKGLEVVVQAILPAAERVRVLMDFLGNIQTLDMEKSALAPPKGNPLVIPPPPPPRHGAGR